MLVTTHSPFFLNALRPDEVRVLWRDEQGYTQTRRAMDLPGVSDFVALHGFEDATAPQVGARESLQVQGQVTFDLAFGLGDQPQAQSVAERGGRGADGK